MLASKFPARVKVLALMGAVELLGLPMALTINSLSAMSAFPLKASPRGGIPAKIRAKLSFAPRWIGGIFPTTKHTDPNAMRGSRNRVNQDGCAHPFGFIPENAGMKFDYLRIIAPDESVASIEYQLAHIVDVPTLAIFAAEQEPYPKQGIVIFDNLMVSRFDRPCDGLLGFFGVLGRIGLARFGYAEPWTLFRDRLAGHKGIHADA